MNMYSKINMTEIRNRMDCRWKTEDKIFHYNNLIQIFARDKAQKVKDANRVHRRQVKQIRELRKDCLYLRSYLGTALFGNKQRLGNSLQRNRTVLLAFQNLWPNKAIEHFQHANNKGQRELDLLKNKKNRRMELFAHLKLEAEELTDRLESGHQNLKSQHTKQILCNGIQTFVARQNAAAEIYKLYKNILRVLRKDSYYFDAILNVLHSDCKEQIQCVLQAVDLGDLAQKEWTDNRKEYKWLERVVKMNMKDYEREVRRIRKNASEMHANCSILTRVESLPRKYIYQPDNFTLKTVSFDGIEEGGERSNDAEELLKLHEIMKDVETATLAPTLHDAFTRILFQVNQEQFLLTHGKKSKDLRNEILRMKNHSELMLATLKQQVTASLLLLEEKEKRLKKAIDDERHRLKGELKIIAEDAEMLATLRVALMATFEMVNKIKETEFQLTSSSDSISDNSLDIEDQEVKDVSPENIEDTFPPPIDQNSLKILSSVIRKLEEILSHFRKPLDKDTTICATTRRLHNALLKRPQIYTAVEIETPLIESEEIEEVGIMTRMDIKMKSKEVVANHNELVFLSQRRLSMRNKSIM